MMGGYKFMREGIHIDKYKQRYTHKQLVNAEK